MAKWFIQINDQVEGPFTTAAVESRLASGLVAQTDLIWGSVQEDWKPLSWWSQSVTQLEEQERQSLSPEVWYYALKGRSFGPLTIVDLTNNLKAMGGSSLEQIKEVLVWTQGMKSWTPLFEFHELLDDLGLNKREFARSSLTGRAVVKILGDTYISSLLSISEGGCGLETIPGLIPGQEVTLELQANEINEAIHAKGEVRYVTDKILGLKFSHLNVESRGAIVQYCKKNGQQFFIKAA